MAKTKFKKKTAKWSDVPTIKGHGVGSMGDGSQDRLWRSVYLYVLVMVAFAVLFIGVVNLQIVEGRDNASRSQRNRIEEIEVTADRGIIYDRNGEKLAINIPSFNVIKKPAEVEEDDLTRLWNILGGLISEEPEVMEEKYVEAMEADPLTKKVLLVQDVTRDEVLYIRSHADELQGVEIEYSSKREYVGGYMYSHVLGYTGEVSPERVGEEEALFPGDIVGLDGIEFEYDERLRGIDGVKIVEIDAAQNVITEYVNEGTAPVAGESVYLSIDARVQEKLHELLLGGMEDYDATGGAAVVENVHTGELIASVSVPDYDNNLFIGGISESDYAGLILDGGGVPLFNRVIAAQVPPGSMFKTIVASAALQEGAITRSTVFNSTGVIYLGDGTYPFQEYHQHAYGPLDLIGGIAKSSNIYFCRTMLELGIDAFVPYAEFFGIGSPSGIDIPGEQSGRVPSPENKIALAETSPWLDPIWYPEGDSCNSAIGQGIATVTPIQVANWAAIIANGGTVLEPHFAYTWEDAEGKKELTEPVVVREGEVDDENLALVREGMRKSASGSLSVIVPLRNTKIPVAGKTGTAEFGVRDEEGFYTRTHAWVMGFFPYDDPQYSFVVFLEGGGESNNSAKLAADLINWWADEGIGED